MQSGKTPVQRPAVQAAITANVESVSSLFGEDAVSVVLYGLIKPGRVEVEYRRLYQKAPGSEKNPTMQRTALSTKRLQIKAWRMPSSSWTDWSVFWSTSALSRRELSK